MSPDKKLRIIEPKTLFVGLIALALGCEGPLPTEKDAISWTHKVMLTNIEHIKNAEIEAEPFSAHWTYVLERSEAAVRFLDERCSIDTPYVITAQLDLSETTKDPGQDKGMLFFDWLEYRTHAKGIVLTYPQTGGARVSRELGLLEHEKWGKEESRMVASTAYRCRRFVVRLSDVDEPLVQQVPTGAKDGPAVTLALPRRFLGKELEMAVYDNAGARSDPVKVFAEWPDAHQERSPGTP